jgi:2-aminoadipate transaminase
MQAEFPPQVSWTRPKGGLFLWGRMPVGMDAKKVLQAAVARNVAFVPGEAFYPHGDVKNTMRLNFSNASEENIRIGIARLGQVLNEQIEAEAAQVALVE